MALPNMAMIPSGYKPTKLYSVLPTPALSDVELVANGDFSNGLTGWSGSDMTVSNEQLMKNGPSLNYQGGVIENNKTYKITIDVPTLGNGLRVYAGGTQVNLIQGVNTLKVSSSNTNDFVGFNGGNGSIINSISVKEFTVADADFTVTRASSATRVNKEGLIETPEFIIGGDVITNGDFSDGSNGWNLFNNTGTSTNITNGVLNIVSDGTVTDASQSNVMIIGKQYKVTLDVIATNGAKLSNNNNSVVYDTSTTGSKDFYIVTDSSTFTLKRFGGVTDVTIDNISVIQVERDNIPRLDYTDGGCPVLLTEPQSTNQLPYSEDYITWSNTDVTLTSGFTSPSGDNSAYSLSTGASGASKINMTINSVSTSSEYSVSVFVKKVGSDNQATLRFYSLESNFDGVAFNFDTKVLSNQVGTTTNRQVQEFSNGWFRISYTFTTPSIVTNPSVQLSRDNASQTVLYYGAQLENLSHATSYMPTYGEIATRASETVSNAGDVNTYNSTEGVLFVEMAALANTTPQEVSFAISEAQSGANRLLIRMKTSGAIGVVLRVANTTQADINSSGLNQSVLHKVAVKWKLNDIALWIDGVEVGTSSLANVFPANTLDEVSFNQGNNSNPFYGKTSQIQVFNTALSDAELLTLTTI